MERSAVVLQAGRMVRWRTGGPAHVDFDWKWVLRREETKGDVAGFFHTHPPGFETMSSRDRRTLEAWAASFGKKLLCAIRCVRRTRGWMCDKTGAAREIEVPVGKDDRMDFLNHERRYRGDEAMKKLATARLCVCGAGAVGSNLVDALARQGARQIRVIDRDRVEPHNAATQVYTSEHVGAPKVEALRDHVFRAAGFEIEPVAKELTAENAKKLLRDVDLVVDGFDNSAARRAVTGHAGAVVHVGLNADYGEVIWNERYRVPSDAGTDVCDYPLARNLVQFVTSVAAEVVLRYVVNGTKESYTITLRDLRVNPEES